MWILTAVCAVLSIILLSGRGAFLIAGYNTAGREEKARYDEKKLCRVMGAGMSVITLILLLCNFELPRGLRWVLPVGIFGVVIFLVIATNTMCRSKVSKAHTDTPAQQKKEKLVIKITVAVLVIAGILTASLLYSGDIKVRMDEDSMNIHAYIIGNKKVMFSDINAVRYESGLDIGRRTGGVGSFRIQAGSFKNDEFGAYHLYSYTDCTEYVVMDTLNGTVAVNGKTPAQTKKLYREITETAVKK